MENKTTFLDFVVKTIRRVALIAIPTGLIYLGSEGEIGVNMATIMSTASPMAVVLLTYVVDLIRWVLPKSVVTIIWAYVSSHIGKDNTTYLKNALQDLPVETLINALKDVALKLENVESTVTLIRKDQETVVPK